MIDKAAQISAAFLVIGPDVCYKRMDCGAVSLLFLRLEGREAVW